MSFEIEPYEEVVKRTLVLEGFFDDMGQIHSIDEVNVDIYYNEATTEYEVGLNGYLIAQEDDEVNSYSFVIGLDGKKMVVHSCECC